MTTRSEDQKLQPMENNNMEQGSVTTTEPEIKYSGWKSMPFIIGNETFEKLGTLGTISNLVVYLTSVFHLKSVTTATLVNVFNGTTNFAPLLGAFFADTYLGRYWTLAIASVASQLGMIIIMLTSAIHKLHPPNCHPGEVCNGPTKPQLAFFAFGLFFLVVGAGGIRPCNLAFGCDQFDPNSEAGKKGITSFFNVYYFTFNVAMVISATIIIYVQSNVNWTIGLAIPAILMVFSCAFYFIGTKIYVRVKPEGSPFTSIAQVFVAAIRKRRLKLPVDLEKSLYNPPHCSSLISKLSHTDQFRFLDKAAIISSSDEIKPNGVNANPWHLCSIQQVEQVKCVIRTIPIWSTTIIYQVASTQQTTYAIFQALQSDRHIGSSNFQIPAGSFIVFPMISMALWLPIYDRLIAPWLQKITKKEGGITILQRMGIGLFICTIAMVISGLVEDKRRSYALHHHPVGITITGSAIPPFSSLWLIPQLALLGLSEAFTVVGEVEFFYKQFPENMRSIAGSLVFLGFSCGSYASSFMVTIVHRKTGGQGQRNWLAEDLNNGRLDMFYYVIALLGVLNFIYFMMCAMWYRYKGEK